jgi:hypothetical protein
MPGKIKKLFAFDFDDTLAITDNLIGVRRTGPDGTADSSFMDWILDNSLDFDSVENKGTENEIVWFSSEDFAHYEQKARKDLEYLSSNSLEDVFDFSETASVDVNSTSPVENIMNIAKKAQSSPQSLVIIITARSGNQNLDSLRGNSVKATNREDISQFLNSQGLSISSGDIHTAGDMGGNPSAKANIMKSYIDQYDPEEVYFYDDNSGNINAVADLCKDYYPHVKIRTFQASPNGSVSIARECF